MNRSSKYHLVFLLCLFFVSAFCQKEIPELWGHRVHDDAKALQSTTLDLLEKKLAAYEDSTSNQIAILIIPSLDGETIEEYSLRVAEKWKLGQKDKDNGVLLLVAIDDHEMRIEVGEGLESVLTDLLCNRIIRNEMAPNFRRNDYDAGVTAGVENIIKAIGGEYTASDADSGSESDEIIVRIVVGLFVFIILGVFTTIAFVLDDKAAWWIYAGLIPFYAAFPWISLGVTGGIILLVIYIIGFPISKILVTRSAAWKKMTSKWITTNNGNKGSSSSSSSSFSSGSSWSSSGGRSFSGGGGSFGGGGSSGKW